MNLLACIGLVWILKDSYILERPRNWIKSKSASLSKLFSCGMCLGFWVGVSLSLFEYYALNNKENIFFNPLAVSAFCWFFDSLLDLIQENNYKLRKERENNK